MAWLLSGDGVIAGSGSWWRFGASVWSPRCEVRASTGLRRGEPTYTPSANGVFVGSGRQWSRGCRVAAYLPVRSVDGTGERWARVDVLLGPICAEVVDR